MTGQESFTSCASVFWHDGEWVGTEIGTERGLLVGNEGAIVGVMGNPSALRSFPDQVGAHLPHTIVAQARRLAKWGGIYDLFKQGFYQHLTGIYHMVQL
jgi:hypothetical protein